MNTITLLKYSVVLLAGFILGITNTKTTIKEVPKEVVKEVKITKEVTPKSCIKALDIDDGVFEKTAEFLGDLDIEKFNAHLEKVLDKRIEYSTDCYAKEV